MNVKVPSNCFLKKRKKRNGLEHCRNFSLRSTLKALPERCTFEAVTDLARPVGAVRLPFPDLNWQGCTVFAEYSAEVQLHAEQAVRLAFADLLRLRGYSGIVGWYTHCWI